MADVCMTDSKQAGASQSLPFSPLLVQAITGIVDALLVISSNITFPLVTWLVVGRCSVCLAGDYYFLGGITPSLGQSLIRSNLSDVAHDCNVLPD